MAKSKEELNALKKEVEAVNEKLAELTEEELAQVSGGAAARVPVPTGSTTILAASVMGSKIEAAN